VALTARYLADFSAWARWRHGIVRDRLANLLNAGFLATCPVVELEFLFSEQHWKGFSTAKSSRGAAMRSLPVTPAVVERALEVQEGLARRQLHRQAKPVDLIVAACAEANDMTVLHYDDDFDAIGEVTRQSTEWVATRNSLPVPAERTYLVMEERSGPSYLPVGTIAAEGWTQAVESLAASGPTGGPRTYGVLQARYLKRVELRSDGGAELV
jgi:predicted nucleic acid-binding protein